MDYLDPRKRRYYNVRLIVGYVLVAIVIGLATVIVVYGANGYGFNTKTGQIVENGLLFVDSKPGGAEIFLNGVDKQTATSARMILPAGNYTLTLKKPGYRDWTRTFALNGQSVGRYVYPFLFPVNPKFTNLRTYKTEPGIITESPSRHWLLVENNSLSGQSPVFNQYDTTTLDKTQPAVTQVSLPAKLLTKYSAASKLTVVEWSTDNNNVLLKHTYPGGSEFIVFDRAKPSESFNVNTTFSVSPDAVSLYNKSVSQLYIYDKTSGTLRLANVSDQTLGQPIIKGALAYKSYAKNLVIYVTANNEPAGRVAAKIWDNGKVYTLFEFKAGRYYLIDLAQYQGDFYYFAGSDAEGRVNIFKNPLNDLTDTATGKAIAFLSLSLPGAAAGSFSDNAQFIGLENGQHFAVYDLQTGDAYNYSVKDPLAANMEWMDGDRYIGESSGAILVMDYDGSNPQRLGSTNLPVGGYFSGNYNHLLTLVPDSKNSGVILQDVDMRAGTDLPKQ